MLNCSGWKTKILTVVHGIIVLLTLPYVYIVWYLLEVVVMHTFPSRPIDRVAI